MHLKFLGSTKNKGFTLIEVLISLSILAIALTAIIKATTQTLRDTLYLENKTVAMWVGTHVLNEARVGILKESLESETEMFHQKWPWSLEFKPTPNLHIKKVTIEVFHPLTQTPLVEMESFIYAP